MRYRKLGKTGLYVSEIGFGTIPILKGNVPVLPNYYNLEEQTAIKVMEFALHFGCNLFDTAIVPEYGDAELKLGQFSKKVGREKIIISDKARFFDGNNMYQGVLCSLQNLFTTPDIYFVHQVDEENADIAFGSYGAIDALMELKKEGKIRFVGVASHYYSVLLRAAEDKRVDVVQGSGNILERGMLDRLEKEMAFTEKGILINKVYAAGILPKFFPAAQLISHVLSYPISSALIGMGTFAEVLAAMEMEFENTRMPFPDVTRTLLKSFSVLPCDRCQLCHCPYGTDISTLFRQYNYFFLGKEYWSLRKLDLGIKESAVLCEKCTNMLCLKQCKNGLQIPDIIQDIWKLVKIHIRNSVV